MPVFHLHLHGYFTTEKKKRICQIPSHTLFDMYLCTLHDTVLIIQRPLKKQHCSNLLRESRSCQQPFQHPAVLLCLTGDYLPAIHSCFSCFQCSAMQKINSSSYSTSTQANLNTASTSILWYNFPPSLFLSPCWKRNQDGVFSYTLSPSNIHLHLHISSSQSPVH